MYVVTKRFRKNDNSEEWYVGWSGRGPIPHEAYTDIQRRVKKQKWPVIFNSDLVRWRKWLIC